MTASVPFRIARVRPHEGNNTTHGEQFFVSNHAADFDSEDGRVWEVIESPFPDSAANRNSAERGTWHVGGAVRQEDFTFLAPCSPANVFGMAHNTGAPGRALPPQAFHKAATSVIGPGEPIRVDSRDGQVDPEAELTVVVGRRCRNLTLGNATEAILGYTIGNDVSARDLQRSDELWISAKSQDTFTPLGPWIVVGLDEADAAIQIIHNGTPLAAARSRDLGWQVREILVYLTGFMTLHPGDVVLTGAPGECRRIVPGDTVSCRIEGIGELVNPVAAAGA
ncbi:MAG TPA: fumarylacetoacetate hydrolase family protein [Micrococcaceae bacterium]|jgi:2-keto-4-pentenoate hydratase/2-oxohepta-3-ene-1,7-dioic acid hydratase in catechol pathway|nr:fumarylacetoacetate hydrolase family protein [Micrococcaceae bacterium]